MKLFQQGEIVAGENKDWDTTHTYYIVDELFVCLVGCLHKHLLNLQFRAPGFTSCNMNLAQWQ